jgi:GxxExxY protein
MSLVRSDVAYEVIGAAIEVHRELGPGLFDHVYHQCLEYVLRKRGVAAATQVPLPLMYDGHRLGCVYRADFVVADQVLVELKSLDRVLPIHEAQVLTYLRLSPFRQALLINFNVRLLKEGIKSFIRKEHT